MASAVIPQTKATESSLEQGQRPWWCVERREVPYGKLIAVQRPLADDVRFQALGKQCDVIVQPSLGLWQPAFDEMNCFDAVLFIYRHRANRRSYLRAFSLFCIMEEIWSACVRY